MTSHHLPERRPKLIDLNLLPPEYQPRKVSRLNIALVILTIVLACLIAPFVFLKADADAESGPLQTRLDQLDSQYRALLPFSTQVRNLQKEIDRFVLQLATINQDYETFQDSLMLWSEIVEDIDDAIPGKRVTLKSITMSERRSEITLKGTATKDDYVWDYATALEELVHFSGVHPTSIITAGTGVSFTMIVPLSGGGE